MNRLEVIIEKYRAELAEKIDHSDFTIKCVKERSLGSYNHYFYDIPFGDYLVTIPVNATIGVENRTIAGFSLSGTAGCCGMAISHGAFVFGSWSNKGIDTILQKIRMDIARENGYTILLCTDIAANTYQNKILAKNGWTKIFDFVNKRTGNNLNVHIVQLNPTEAIKALTLS